MYSSRHVTCTKSTTLTVGEVKGIWRLSRPQPHRVDIVAAIPRDGVVVGDRHHHLCVLPSIYLSSAIEVDRNGVLWTRQLPRVAIAQPIVGFLYLRERREGCDKSRLCRRQWVKRARGKRKNK